MSHPGGIPALGELERLGDRIAAGRPRHARAWEPLRGLLSQARAAPADAFERRLARALETPGPAAAGLLCLRLGSLAGLSEEACLDLAQAAMLARSDLSALADSRIRRRGGAVVSADVLRLAACAAERLDGGGPLGLRGEELDASSRLLAAAWAYLDARSSSGAEEALAALRGRPQAWASEAVGLLASALPSPAALERPEPAAPAEAPSAPLPAPEPSAPRPEPIEAEALAERMRRALEAEGRKAALAEAQRRRRQALEQASAAFAEAMRRELARVREALASDRGERAALRSMREEVEKAARLLGATQAEVDALLAAGAADKLAAARARQVERLERVAGLVRRRQERVRRAAESRARERERYARRLAEAIERAARSKRRKTAKAEERLAELTEALRKERERLAALRASAGDPWAQAASELARLREDWEAESPAAMRARDEGQRELSKLDRELAGLLRLLEDLDRRRQAETAEHERAMDELRARAARELRRARAGAGAPELRAREALLRRRLEEEKVAQAHLEALAEHERRACASATAELRGRLEDERRRWSDKTKDLQERVLQRKRLVDDARRTLAELARRREETEASWRAERARFELMAAARLAHARRALRERRELLRECVAGLEAQARRSEERAAEAAAACEERRSRLEGELRALRAEAGDLRGRLAAGAADGEAMRRTLEAALSELDLALTEAYFAADAARRALASARLDRERLSQELERASRELEPLAAGFEREAEGLEARLDGLRELSGARLEGLDALLRGRLLAGARDLDLWLARAAEVGRRLALLRRSLEGRLGKDEERPQAPREPGAGGAAA